MDLKTLNPKAQKIVVGGKFVLKERLGGGSFGQVYSASNTTEDTVSYAVKLEKKFSNGYSTISKEAKVISDMKDAIGFPTLYSYGKEDEYNYMVINLLGNNLEKLFKLCHFRFSLKTVLMLANQMLSRIEALHERNYLHRDIKPENFCMGVGHTRKTLFLIDFGLARSYKDMNGKHIPPKDNRGLVGTARYASINSHLGLELSRRDDLEEIGYTLIYLIKGFLPWQNIKARNKAEKYELIKEKKIETPLEQLCKGLPVEFITFMSYVKSLGFSDTPNYGYLKKIFKDLLMNSGFELDYQYDWLYHPNYLALKTQISAIHKPQVSLRGSVEPKIEDFKKEDNSACSENIKANVFIPRFADIIGENSKSKVEDRNIQTLEATNQKSRKIDKVVKIISQKFMDNIKHKDWRSRIRNNRQDFGTTTYHSSKALNFTLVPDDDEIPAEVSVDNAPENKIEQTASIVVQKKDFSNLMMGQTTSVILKKKINRNLINVGGSLELGTLENHIRQNNKKHFTLPGKNNLMNLKRNEEKDNKKTVFFQENQQNDYDEENISESLICEWGDGKNLSQMVNKQRFNM